MTENEWTSIAIRATTKDELDTRKVHPRQSYDEVIQELLKPKPVEEAASVD